MGRVVYWHVRLRVSGRGRRRFEFSADERARKRFNKVRDMYAITYPQEEASALTGRQTYIRQDDFFPEFGCVGKASSDKLTLESNH